MESWSYYSRLEFPWNLGITRPEFLWKLLTRLEFLWKFGAPRLEFPWKLGFTSLEFSGKLPTSPEFLWKVGATLMFSWKLLIDLSFNGT